MKTIRQKINDVAMMINYGPDSAYAKGCAVPVPTAASVADQIADALMPEFSKLQAERDLLLSACKSAYALLADYVDTDEIPEMCAFAETRLQVASAIGSVESGVKGGAK